MFGLFENKSKLAHDLQAHFKTVDKSIFEHNSTEALEFLLKALRHYNIYLPDVELLGHHDNAHKDIEGAIVQNKDNTIAFMYLQTDRHKLPIDQQFVILHEIGHIKQIQSGRLRILDQLGPFFAIRWEGKEQVLFESDYAIWPHELDADMFAYESPLFDLSKMTPEARSYRDAFIKVASLAKKNAT